MFDFKLDIKDAGGLLERFGQPTHAEGEQRRAQRQDGWRGGPTAIDYPTLNGNIAVDLRHGQILKVDPGVAKLLGVLSLQSLARFATLNFRDVIGEGLPFEHVTGTAQIRNGIGRTENFEMVTAPARAEMKGSGRPGAGNAGHARQDRADGERGRGGRRGRGDQPAARPARWWRTSRSAIGVARVRAGLCDNGLPGSKPHIERVKSDRG